MDHQLLFVILGAAATSFLVAAALARLFHRYPGSRWPAPVALAAGLIPASRIGLGAWPSFPPTQAADWWLPLALASIAVFGTLSLLSRRTAPIATGLVVGILILRGPLAHAAAADHFLWQAAVVTAAAAVCLSVARASDPPTPSAGLIAMFILGAPAILFAAFSAKLSLLMLAAGFSLIGVAASQRRRTNLSLAAPPVALGYSALWLTAYFTGNDFGILTLALALAAPATLMIRASPRLVCLAAATPLIVIMALYAPGYLHALGDLRSMP